MIPCHLLQHGDVLAFTHRSHQSLFVRGIRFITGSQFTHVGIIQKAQTEPVDLYEVSYVVGVHLVVEQLTETTFEPIDFYHDDVGEQIFAFRPKFTVPATNYERLHRYGYNYWLIVDSMINHAMSRITLGHWHKREMLGKLKPMLEICSTLVGLLLGLADHRTIEPNYYANHPELFDPLGEVGWSS